MTLGTALTRALRAEVAMYDALRDRGRVIAEIRPARPLGPVGPTITLIDLRD